MNVPQHDHNQPPEDDYGEVRWIGEGLDEYLAHLKIRAAGYNNVVPLLEVGTPAFYEAAERLGESMHESCGPECPDSWRDYELAKRKLRASW